MRIFLPFDSFLPGGSAYGPGLVKAENVLPFGTGLYPLRTLAGAIKAGTGSVNTSSVADAPVTGAAVHVYPSGGGSGSYVPDLSTILAGTKTKLYDVSAGAFSDISRGGGYAVAAGAEPAGWRFASDGNDVWAANGYDIIQRRAGNTGNFADGPTSTFTPKARFLAKVRQFMVAADLSGNGAGYGADEIAWPDIDDATWWDDNTGTRKDSLAGRQPVRSRPGQITGLTGGEFGRIYKRRSIHVLQFTGLDDVFRLDEISHGTGCVFPGSLISGKDADYFHGGDGFYAASGMEAPQKVSPPEIDLLFTDPYQNASRTVLGSLATMAREDAIMMGVESRKSGILAWFYGNNEISSGQTLAFFFNPRTGAWTEGTIPFSINAVAALPGVTDGFISNDLLRILAFVTISAGNSQLMTFCSSPMTATIKTKRRPLAADAPGQGFRVDAASAVTTTPRTLGTTAELKPSVPPVTITVTAGNDPFFEDQLDGDGTVVSPRSESGTSTSNMNDYGAISATVEGLFFDFQVAIASGTEWTAIDGIYVDAKATGSVG